MIVAHEVTTAHLGAAYPFMVGTGLGASGVYIGRDLLGGVFTFDPFDLYNRGMLTNANVIVFGQVGRGKSSLVKSFLWRQSVFGRQAWVVDPKGEYSGLAGAWGVRPLRVHPGGSLRLNPLDAGSEDGEDADLRRLELVVALGSASLGRPLLPTEHAAAELALREASRCSSGRPTIPDVVQALLEPSIASARELRCRSDELVSMGRDLAFELRRLVEGDLRGMFDGQTSDGIDLSGPLVVLDLSAVYGSPALGVLMTCATAWLNAQIRAARTAGTLGQRFVVVDEAWAILSNLAVARWLQSSWKLSRSFGVSNVAVLHRLSDLSAAGAAGSEQVNLAQGLLSDSETRIIYAQSPGEVASCNDALDLTSTEAELLPQLGRSVALWKVGGRSFVVEHRLGTAELAIIDTDQAMRLTSGSTSSLGRAIPPASQPTGGFGQAMV